MGDDQAPEDETPSPAQPDDATRIGELTAGEPDEPSEEDFADPAPAEARPRDGWRKRTATGAILSGLAMAFQQVFEDRKQDVSVIMETSGVPPTDLPVEAEFDHMAPRRSVVKIRPWLLGDTEAGDTDTDTDSAETDSAETDSAETGSTDTGGTDTGGAGRPRP